MNQRDELKAMQQIAGALEPLDDEVARARVLMWALESFGLSQYTGRRIGPPLTLAQTRAANPSSAATPNSANPSAYANIGELFENAAPKTTADRVLVASYWFQVIRNEPDVSSQKVNNELKNMGFGVGNITKVYGRLMKTSPALVRQIEKRGKSTQARKRMAVTTAGRARVEAMLAGVRFSEEEPE